MNRTLRTLTLLAAVVCLGLLTDRAASAEVTRLDVTTRQDVLGGKLFGAAGAYEQVRGRIHFAVDPAHPPNARIADITLAPRNSTGRVEFEADFWMLAPKDPARGNGTALLEVVNRGNRTIRQVVRGTPSTLLTTDGEFGDGLLLNQGFTIVWVGWQFDVVPGNNRMGLTVPRAPGVRGTVRATFVPADRMAPVTVDTLDGYRPAQADDAANALFVLDGGPGTHGTPVPRARWHLTGNTVSVDGGFEPGRTYELAYGAVDPPISGLGYAAVRDTASWLKRADSAAPVHMRQAIAFGVSQSGRFLRGFLYDGFNADEQGRQVFDGVMAHIAGASRIDINRRWATPTSQGQYDATAFPFAAQAMRDPVTGATDGLLENPRVRGFEPKVMFTNTPVEYWGGARNAALIHLTPDGKTDVAPPSNVRIYFFAGTQHTPSTFPPQRTLGQQLQNANDYYWLFRSLIPAMHHWVVDGTAPPASRYPTRREGGIVPIEAWRFPRIPTAPAPTAEVNGLRVANPGLPRDGAPGTALPFLVPAVNDDGNEPSGIQLPELAVPLGTYAGWNLRRLDIGAPQRLVPLMGGWIPFPRTAAEATASGDPRRSISARYASRDAFLAQARTAGAALARDGFLPEADVEALVREAGLRWDYLLVGGSK